MSLSKNTLYPLTQSQLSLWLGQKLNPNSPINNVPYAFYIYGDLNVDVFNKSFQKLIEDVDVLRTVFVEKEDSPYQQVIASSDYNLEFIDFTQNSNHQIVNNWLENRSEIIFDVSERLFDSALLKVDNKEFIWFLNIHHLITDASSSIILFDRMSEIYGEIKLSNKYISNKLPSFINYIEYEAEQSEINSETKNYWQQKTKSFNELPLLYGAKKSQKVTTKSNRVVLKLDLEKSQKIRSIAKQSNVRGLTEHATLFNIFSSLLFIYLFRIGGQKRLAIGAPVHNRISKNYKKTAGLFIEIFPFTLELFDDDTFYSVLQRIKIESNEFLKNAETGTASSLVTRSFNTIFNYIASSFSTFDGLSTKAEWIHPNHCDPGHHLRCHVYDFNATGEIQVAFDINENVISKAKASVVANHFLEILEAFIDDINQPIQKQCLLSSEEISSFLVPELKNNNPYISILELFETIVKEKPNSIALQCSNETLTFKGLNKKANQLANHLLKKGVKSGKKVALYYNRSTDYIVALMAVMKTGATFIPIASDQPTDRVKFIITNSNCSLVLCDAHLKGRLFGLDVNIIDQLEIGELVEEESVENLNIKLLNTAVAYVLYTSGSTGNPKGVLISNSALSNYLLWAKEHYSINANSILPLFTSIGFDLTITSTLLPLISGGRLIVYKENPLGLDMSLMQLLGDNIANVIKLTPSHLTFLKDRDLSKSNIKTMIVGGEDFKVNLGKAIKSAFGNNITIFNEYGPTEATVGCIVSEFDIQKHDQVSIPIGVPIKNMHAYILDDYKNLVPNGVVGELYLSGASLAEGYLGLDDLTKEKFIDNPFVKGFKMYHTGDLARINEAGEYEYLGRVDEQVKLRGYRIELADIESNVLDIDGVENCAVVLTQTQKVFIPEEEIINCVECGLPSNYPDADFDTHGVCHLCNAFKGYKENAQKYFKTEDELKSILTSKIGDNKTYDCLSLLSGGKDSTYILAQLVCMGLKVLAFTLDNGYISEQAKNNIDKIVEKLGVDHIYGKTNHMNDIFVDSLKRHKNVCNGCFKTIYTLSTKIAMEKEIPFIVTGLSRGQFFETRLTEELFWDEELDVTKIDDTILEVRKLYHKEQDAVKDLLDVSMFEDDEVFEKVQFIDFYRYSDVSLEDMLTYLDEKVNWVRPTDTGRSTNCLINQVGIYVHKKEKGYSNYSFPYSWDVRLGHKTRDESLEEINEYIEEAEVKRVMNEIGYEESDPFEDDKKLVAYYTGDSSISIKTLKSHLAKKLPAYMIPSTFKYLEEIPLTKNGKVDKKTLKSLNIEQLEMETSYVAPRNEIDELIEAIWKEVLRLNKIGIHDNFIALGGHSLAAIRVTSRINEELEMNIPLNKIFNLPTIEEYSNYIEKTMLELL